MYEPYRRLICNKTLLEKHKLRDFTCPNCGRHSASRVDTENFASSGRRFVPGPFVICHNCKHTFYNPEPNKEVEMESDERKITLKLSVREANVLWLTMVAIRRGYLEGLHNGFRDDLARVEQVLWDYIDEGKIEAANDRAVRDEKG